MRHHPAVDHIRVPVRGPITFFPVIDHPLLPSIGIALPPVVGRDFHGVLHAVGVCGAVIGELQLVALAVVLVKGVGVLGFCSHI